VWVLFAYPITAFAGGLKGREVVRDTPGAVIAGGDSWHYDRSAFVFWQRIARLTLRRETIDRIVSSFVAGSVFDLSKACVSHLSHSSDTQTACVSNQRLACQNGWQSRRD